MVSLLGRLDTWQRESPYLLDPRNQHPEDHRARGDDGARRGPCQELSAPPLAGKVTNLMSPSPHR